MKELIEKLKTCRLMYRNDICHLLLNTEEMNIIIQALSLKEASKDTSESDKELQAPTSVKSESAEDKQEQYLKHLQKWIDDDDYANNHSFAHKQVKVESAEEVLKELTRYEATQYNGMEEHPKGSFVSYEEVDKAMHNFANADKKQHAKILENTYIKCMVEELINRHHSSFVELDIPTDYKKQILYELGISPDILDY